MKSTLAALVFFLAAYLASAQNCGDLNLQWQSDIPSTCDTMTMTMLPDQLARPYLYVANKEGGLAVYDHSDPAAPFLVSRLPSELFGLEVMNLTQQGNHLYLALGNFFGLPFLGGAGMAIVDVTDPVFPAMTNSYIADFATKGAGDVKVEGNYAYLGMMRDGLVVLDVSDPEDITLVSHFVPDIDFPVPDPNPDLYNARGLAVRDGIVYLCYDAGGLRIIDCTDPELPVETGRFANPVLHEPFNLPRAYNNVVLDDSLAYLAVDYCGVEVVNVADPGNITLTGWWNPYGCPDNNWFSSPVHTNELYFDPLCDHLFVSAARLELVVLDVSEPATPTLCTAYGEADNNLGTWGVSGYQEDIYLSYVCALVPFTSNWTGIQLLTYTPCPAASVNEERRSPFYLYPNPAAEVVNIEGPLLDSEVQGFVVNGRGQTVRVLTDATRDRRRIDTRDLPTGLYFVVLEAAGRRFTLKFLVSR